MKKYILFLLCLIVSVGLLVLSLSKNSISCVKSENSCVFISKIQYLNIELNREKFPLESINNVSCEQQTQPSRRGKKHYYTLTLDVNNRPYYIDSFAKYKDCKYTAKSIKQDYKDKSIDKISFNPAFGLTNFTGFIFAFIFLLIGIIILKSEDIQDDTQFEEDEDDE